jgi:hypothetical protein
MTLSGSQRAIRSMLRRLFFCSLFAFWSCSGSSAPDVVADQTGPSDADVLDMTAKKDTKADTAADVSDVAAEVLDAAADHLDPDGAEIASGDLSVDAESDVGEPLDLGCVPDCILADGTTKQCGPDGCGYICGVCLSFDLPNCNAEGICVAECEADCDGKQCGPDGCGNVCGYCNPGQICDADGQCGAPCVPNCTNQDGSPKQCGPDGCNSSCGFCDEGLVCGLDGACVFDCTPQCAGKFCGPDDCGSLCGQCLIDFICKDDGLCYQDCVPNCDGKDCGSDGCTGFCGVCGFSEECMGGQCVTTSCGAIPAFGICEGSILTYCDQGVVANVNCLATDQICLWNPAKGAYDCVDPPECIPNCANKVCGPDECGSVCGFCTPGWSCDNEGQECTPQPGGTCGPFSGAAGHCVDELLWFCENNVLYQMDCGAMGLECSFDPQQGKNTCQ